MFCLYDLTGYICFGNFQVLLYFDISDLTENIHGLKSFHLSIYKLKLINVTLIVRALFNGDFAKMLEPRFCFPNVCFLQYQLFWILSFEKI